MSSDWVRLMIDDESKVELTLLIVQISGLVVLLAALFNTNQRHKPTKKFARRFPCALIWGRHGRATIRQDKQ